MPKGRCAALELRVVLSTGISAAARALDHGRSEAEAPQTSENSVSLRHRAGCAARWAPGDIPSCWSEARRFDPAGSCVTNWPELPQRTHLDELGPLVGCDRRIRHGVRQCRFCHRIGDVRHLLGRPIAERASKSPCASCFSPAALNTLLLWQRLAVTVREEQRIGARRALALHLLQQCDSRGIQRYELPA